MADLTRKILCVTCRRNIYNVEINLDTQGDVKSTKQVPVGHDKIMESHDSVCPFCKKMYRQRTATAWKYLTDEGIV